MKSLKEIILCSQQVLNKTPEMLVAVDSALLWILRNEFSY